MVQSYNVKITYWPLQVNIHPPTPNTMRVFGKVANTFIFLPTRNPSNTLFFLLNFWSFPFWFLGEHLEVEFLEFLIVLGF